MSNKKLIPRYQLGTGRKGISASSGPITSAEEHPRRPILDTYSPTPMAVDNTQYKRFTIPKPKYNSVQSLGNFDISNILLQWGK